MRKYGYYFGESAQSALNSLFYDAISDVLNVNHVKREYDPEQYDLVPKRSYTEKRIMEKEQALLSLGERRNNINRQLNEEEKALKLEIDQLKQKLDK